MLELTVVAAPSEQSAGWVRFSKAWRPVYQVLRLYHRSMSR